MSWSWKPRRRNTRRRSSHVRRNSSTLLRGLRFDSNASIEPSATLQHCQSTVIYGTTGAPRRENRIAGKDRKYRKGSKGKRTGGPTTQSGCCPGMIGYFRTSRDPQLTRFFRWDAVATPGAIEVAVTGAAGDTGGNSSWCIRGASMAGSVVSTNSCT